jgi:hypothetical protein
MARVMGTAILLFAGNCIPGTTSKMFEKSMKKNIVVRKGKYFFPSGPIVSITTDSSTKVIPDSATCCTPTGTSDPRCRPAVKKIADVIKTAARYISTVLLTANIEPEKIMSGHSKR